MNKKQTTQFILARHGETKWNRLRRLQGHLNSELTQTGIEQASELASCIANDSIEILFSSPLERALNTAKICQNKLSLKLVVNNALVERHFGDWQGAFFDELTQKPHFEKIFSQVTEHKPPSGEAGLDCGVRISQALAEIAMTQLERKILVITHGDAIRCFLATLAQESQCDAYSQYGNGKTFPVEFCHLTNEFSFC
jgi:broad specificity phosphatase PhoE